LAAGLGLALVMGFLAVRLRLPALVGYLLAGVAIGPHSPGFVADASLASQVAEIGVMLLMFGVGLHFSIQDLLSVKRIALPGAILQIAVATAMGVVAARFWGWDFGAGLVFGLALSVASTVVLLRALEALGILDSVNGRIAVGWLVVEDLVTVLVLVLLPPLASLLGAHPSAGAHAPEQAGMHPLLSVGMTLGKVCVFVALMLLVGRRFFPWLLWQVARTGSRELFTLCVVAAAVGVAYGSSVLFGVSFALGAFFSGMVLRESDLSYRAAEESEPLRDAFSVLFFVSVGMLFDPRILMEHPIRVAGVVSIILFGKSVAAFALVLAFRYPINTALTVSAALAQIGEFSFILAGLGVTLGLLPPDGQSLILAGAIISIALNPLVFKAIGPLQTWFRARSGLTRMLERSADPLAQLPSTVEPAHVTGHVIVVGYGRVGRHMADALAEKKIPFVAVDQNRERVEKLRAEGHKAVAGDAADPAVLIQAHVARARVLAIALPDVIHIPKMAELARTLNPGIEIVVRCHSEEESDLLLREKVGRVYIGEHELAQSMTRYVEEKVIGT
jgi:CPA2 family monovalent cation:H+ antiporter-2